MMIWRALKAKDIVAAMAASQKQAARKTPAAKPAAPATAKPAH
jgi:hypothetical protein